MYNIPSRWGLSMDFRQASRNTWKTEGRSNIFAAGARARVYTSPRTKGFSFSFSRFHRLFSSSSLNRRLDFVTPRANKGIVAVKRNIIGEEKERREIVDGGEVEERGRMVEERWIYERKGSSPNEQYEISSVRTFYLQNLMGLMVFGFKIRSLVQFERKEFSLSVSLFCFSIVCQKREGYIYIYTFFLHKIFVFFRSWWHVDNVEILVS